MSRSHASGYAASTVAYVSSILPSPLCAKNGTPSQIANVSVSDSSTGNAASLPPNDPAPAGMASLARPRAIIDISHELTWSAGVSYVLLKLVGLFVPLRVSREHELEGLKEARGVQLDTDLSGDDLKLLVQKYKAVYKKGTGSDFPQDPKDQLWAAIMAVFNSWEGHKAIEYRRIEKISGLKGTAVNVQAMVFGNLGDNSGTGVAFTRDPNTGEDLFYGDYLINAYMGFAGLR